MKSPTYTLIEPYEPGGRSLYHLDLYRLGDPEELEYLGLRDLLGGEALILVEWPERAGTALPPADLELRIAHAGEARDLEIDGPGPRAAALIQALALALRDRTGALPRCLRPASQAQLLRASNNTSPSNTSKPG